MKGDERVFAEVKAVDLFRFLQLPDGSTAGSNLEFDQAFAEIAFLNRSQADLWVIGDTFAWDFQGNGF